MTLVKICGITNLDDALHAANSGADILGFIFYPESKRAITVDGAAAIAKQLPKDILKTGVFVNGSINEVVDIVRTAELNAIQLQGDETREYIFKLRSETTAMIVKTVHVQSGNELAEIDGYSADGIMLDSFSSTERGGTGKTTDWSIAEKIARRIDRFYLAGGLAPDNVTEAIQQVRPYAVDACSRLEMSPGRKDHAKVAAFIKAAKEAI